MELHRKRISKTVRIWSHGDLARARRVWVCLHGYAQNVEGFAKVLEVLKNENAAVIVPEGPHRFYTQGFSGDVGASWMTKEDRLEDIGDYTGYLNGLFDQFDLDGKEICILGFSQGAATACRWVSSTPHQISKLVLWAGVIPPDLDLQYKLNKLRTLRPTLVIGDQDEFLTEERVGQLQRLLEEWDVPFELIRFVGKHRLNRKVLRSLAVS